MSGCLNSSEVTEMPDKQPDISSLVDCIMNYKLYEALQKVNECQLEHSVNLPTGYPVDSALFMECPHDEENRIMTEAGAKYVHHGSARNVYRFNNCVVKIANNIASREDNVREETIWENAPASERQYLTPIVESRQHGLYVTMPYVNTPKSVSAVTRTINEIRGGMAKHGFDCPDIHDENVGRYKGKPVLLDYGSGVLSCSRNEG